MKYDKKRKTHNQGVKHFFILWIKIRWKVLPEEEVQNVLAAEQYKYVKLT